MPSMPERLTSRHPELPDKAVAARAKALIRKPDEQDAEEAEDEYRTLIGRAIQRCAELAGTPRLEQFAARVKRDPRTVARWINGKERPQLDAIWAVPELRVPLVQGFAEQCEQEFVEVKTVITLKQERSA